MADDLGERTEDPTPKRLAEARREGTIAKSQELSAALMLLGATLVVAVVFLPTLARFRRLMESVLTDDVLGSPGGESARKIRQAMSLAYDRDRWLKVMRNGFWSTPAFDVGAS